jgi:isopentenyl-diphosphate Delta-isomerase
MQKEILIPTVDVDDNIIGNGEKLSVHLSGQLHRAFSILIYNEKGQMLIHQRAMGKYHSEGLWTNACCGHPNVGESMETAVKRRLQEEMGIVCTLEFDFKFQYRAVFENGLIENEIDHVYRGVINSSFEVNPEEVMAYKWANTEEIKADMEGFPKKYTVWFKKIIEIIQ